MKILMEEADERKQNYLAHKEFVLLVLGGIKKQIRDVIINSSSVDDEIMIGILANCESMLKNILDNFTYKQ